MKLYLSLIILIIYCVGAVTQVDTIYTLQKLKKATSFATMTMGGDLLSIPGGTMNINGNKTNLSNSFMPRFNIGATHFWGHADFYVTFPLISSFSTKPAGVLKYSFKESVETGAKVYPWPIKKDRLRPYMGISFQPQIFKITTLESQYGGAENETFITPIHLGLTYATSKYLVNFGVRHNSKVNYDYYIDKSRIAQIKTSPITFNFSIFRYFDVDRSAANKNFVDQSNIKHYLLKKHNKISTWYVGVGATTALEMSKSSYFKKIHPYFNNDMTNSFISPEISFGRYLHGADMNINASFRFFNWNLKAFDTKANMKRTSLALEPYKFLFDYHGFVPFIGPSLNIEKLSYNENNNELSKEKKLALGIVFGWDIRVTQTSTSLLRTNLRYIPNHHLKIGAEKIKFDHLEFNFIQYIHFFGRTKIYKQYTKK
jgi:hypothetical protein